MQKKGSIFIDNLQRQRKGLLRLAVVGRDGEIHLRGLPYRRGEKVGMNVRPVEPGGDRKPPLTARRLLDSGLVDMWEDQDDIGDSVTYARYLREETGQRGSRA